MDDIKKTLLENLQEFHNFCEKHDLEYFIIGGTLLGAVRHEGFIPWDDDADVVMPRKDYDRLLELYDQFDYPFKLKSPKNIKNFRIPFAKLTNETIVITENTFVPFKNGVWLDIFPLDYTFDNESFQNIHFSLIKKIKFLIELKYDLCDKQNFSRKGKILAPYATLFSKIMPRQSLNLLLSLTEMVPHKLLMQRNNYANLYGAWGIKETAPTKIFNSKRLYQFEYIQLWGPEDYHYWLTKVYGNYMELPPIADRTPSHGTREK